MSLLGESASLVDHSDEMRAIGARSLARRSISGCVVPQVGCLVLFFATDFHRDHAFAFWMLSAAALVLGSARLALALRFETLDRRAPRRARLAFHGLTWSAAGWWSALAITSILAYGHTGPTILVVILIAGVTSGAVSSLCADRVLQKIYLLLVLVPTAIALAVYGGGQGVAIGSLCLVYCGFLLVEGRYQHRHYWSSVLRNLQLHAYTKELESARRSAEQATRAKSSFLANMSHEIRTPMNGVLGMAELLLEGPLDDRKRPHVVTLQNSAGTLLRILDDILDVSKIEAGKLSIEILDFDPREVAEEVRQLFAARAAEKRLALAVEFDPEVPPMLRGDPVRIRQVLSNLVGNAIKFTDQGSVTVRGMVLEKRGEAVLLELAVIDTGIGIAKDRQQSIFDSFTQADDGTARRFGGTGLGLTISRRLAELMGGTLQLESAPGRGSTFKVEALFAPGAVAARAATTAAITESFQGARRMRVLLVEDNAVNQQVAFHMLRMEGADAEIVESGALALAALENGRFDLVFMDIEMPGMDGFETTKAIRDREAESHEHVPIVAMTAHALQGDRERCLAAGMNDYLSKPIRRADVTALFQRMRPALEQRLALRVFDVRQLRTVSGGDAELERHLIRGFVERTRPILDEMKTAIGSNDARRLERRARAVAGGAASLGAEVLAEAARRLERIAGEGRLAPAPAALKDVRAACDALQQALDAHLATLPPENENRAAA